jgi:MutS domain V
MPSDSSSPVLNPADEYRRRLDHQLLISAARRRRVTTVAYTQLAFLLLSVATGAAILFVRSVSGFWIFPPVIGFLVLAVVHQRAKRRLRTCLRTIAFYERNLARIENRWMGAGETGDRFQDPSHPYSRDLDLFGNGSMFQLLCASRTRAGEETLARWLLARAAPEEVGARNAAVAELTSRVDLREDLAILGEDLPSNIQPDALSAWAEIPPLLQSQALRIALPVLAILWIASLVFWALWDVRWLVVAMTVLNFFVQHKYHERAASSLASIGDASHDLNLLTLLLARLERETFSAPLLVALRAGFSDRNLVVSETMARLNRWVDLLLWSDNFVAKILDRVLLWNLQCAFAIDAWRKQFGPSVRGWLRAVGELEALSDFAGYAYEHPRDVFPEFTAEAPPCFDAEGLAHPLIPEDRAVPNHLHLSDRLRLLIISGPNMAGKSTLIRAVGINVVLAQSGAPVRARRLRLSPLSVAASVVVLDSLQGGISRFYSEILRLKQITDLAKGPIPVLFLLDEFLQGTNSHDRRIGAEAILRTLFERRAIGLVSTHDLALTEIAVALGPRAANAHFEDRLEEGKLRFDHHLSPGVVQTSNALELMRSIGLEV